MARTKAPQVSSVEQNINNKIASIEEQIKTLQADLKHWQKVASDYETNRVTIESILSVHNAPDVAVSNRGGKRAATKAKPESF